MSASKCDRCGEVVTNLDAGFSPSRHGMMHGGGCGGTWRPYERPSLFTCWGPSRGGCGVAHDALEAADRCSADDATLCQLRGGTSDRDVRLIHAAHEALHYGPEGPGVDYCALGLEAIAPPGRRVALRRLPHYGDGRKLARFRDELVPFERPPTVDIDMGLLAPDQPWWELPLPPCPDCGRALSGMLGEAGNVPGARGCACGSLFVVEVLSPVKP